MHDIRAIRENPDAYVAGWSARGVEDASGVVARILELDRELRAAQTEGQEALAGRNAASKAIGAAMGKGDAAEAERLKVEVETFKGVIAETGEREGAVGAELRDLLAGLKNLAAADVPDGEDEAGNVEVKTWGEPRRTGPAKDHADLGEAMGLLDFEAAAKMSGARFAVIKGGLARLERAIGQFMLDMQTDKHGYTEVNPPYLVRDEAMFGTGQLPKFYDDLFLVMDPETRTKLLLEALANHTAPQSGGPLADLVTTILSDAPTKEQLFAIPTAEVSLTNLVREQILAEDDLATPMRLTALTPCFRAEAGSAGRDTRGLIRQHQFSKVEMVSITRPEDSEAEHERMTGCAEAVLEALGLP